MLKGTVEDLLANRLDVDLKLTSTSTSIVVNVETKEGYPISYSYQITGSEDYKQEKNNLKESTYTFEKLKIDTEYNITVTVKNKAGLIKEIKRAIKTLAPAEPELEGMTPVIYKNNNWVVADTTKDKWYDYENQEWANAVLLKSGVSKTVGDTITVEGDNPEAIAMFVWIPRYEYKIVSDYNIDVNFISKSTTYENTNSDGYRIHPAFTFDSQELSGIWVGKFETSHTTLSASIEENNLGCSNNNCSNADGLRILPNVESLRYNDISNFFYAAQSMDNRLKISGDLHIMKNSEWGAVAYLSQSKYGKYGNTDYKDVNKEIYQNKSSGFITGNSNGTPSQASAITTQYTYDVELLGTGASTTGNITGIYDMSGGAWEYVMGYYESEHASLPWGSSSTENYAGFTVQIPSKYYDSYTSTILTEACGGGVCYGHALSETAGWYGDHANFAYSMSPWLARGGFYNYESTAGIYARNYASGILYGHASFRIVLTPTT